ncbi:MAG: VCBS repeat-containing protein, partial [Polyangiaceae bacterium]|nr:VCBS repeat-containing protein [Polyangiaceae bacterium]
MVRVPLSRIALWLLTCVVVLACGGVVPPGPGPGVPALCEEPDGTNELALPARVTARPDGARVGGSIPGSGNVTNRGSARYTMGFELPPGRRGMQPTLSLEYDSDSPNGLVGRGMHLAGLSHIAPCARTLILDGVSLAPRYDGTDPLCLDGMRMVQLPDHSYVTVPSSHARIVRLDNGFEVTTPDGMIQRYGVADDAVQTTTDQPRAWALSQVRDGYGNTIEYRYENTKASDRAGAYTTSHLPTSIFYTGHASGLGPDKEVRLVWEARPDPSFVFERGLRLERDKRLSAVQIVVQRVVERSYDFTYEASPQSGVSRLARVTERAVPTGDTRPPTRFVWTDASPGDGPFRGTSAFPTLDTGFLRSQLSNYTLADMAGTGLDMVAYPEAPHEETVREKGVQRKILVSTWKVRELTPVASLPGAPPPSAETFATFTTPYTGAATGGARDFAIPVDLDLDGRTDLVTVNNAVFGLTYDGIDWGPKLSPSTDQVVEPATFKVFMGRPGGVERVELRLDTDNTRSVPVFGDFNGDGAPDVIDRGVVRLHKGTQAPAKDGFLEPFEAGGPHLAGVALAQEAGHLPWVLDIDGDGRSDILTKTTADGVHFAPTLTWFRLAWTPPAGGMAGYWTVVEHDSGLPSDLLPRWRENGTNWSQLPSSPHFGDVNGDGLADLVVGAASDGTQGSVPAAPTVRYNRGDGTFGGEEPLPGAGDGERVRGMVMATSGDWNHDGKVDFLVPTLFGPSSGHLMLLASGATEHRWIDTGIIVPDLTALSSDPNAEGAVAQHATQYAFLGPRFVRPATRRFGSDLLAPTVVNGRVVHRVIAAQDAPFDRLAAVYDGLSPSGTGGERDMPRIRFHYGTINEAALDTPGCAFPAPCTVGSRPVVTMTTHDAGTAQPVRVTHEFRGGRTSVRGRGFLGFSEITHIDGDRREDLRFDNRTAGARGDFPFASFAARRTLRFDLADGVRETHERRTTHELVDLGPTYFVYRKSDSQDQARLSSSPPDASIYHSTTETVSEVTPDGRPRRLVVERGSRTREVTTFSYVPLPLRGHVV